MTRCMGETHITQGMIVATMVICERMTQSKFETYNMQGMIVGYNGQPQAHDPEHD